MIRKLHGLALLTGLMLGPLPCPAQAQAPVDYRIVSQDAGAVEVRFRGLPLRAVHADDAQNALSIDFQTPVDGAVFDRLSGDLPQWVSMAYANFDNGVIRSPRPVTFMTRAESDGFSLRIVARNPNPPPVVVQAAPPPPMRQDYAPPPPPAAFHPYGAYGALRAYTAQELAIRRGDPVWQDAYARAAMQSDSSIGLGSEVNWYHGGDRVIASDLTAKLSLADGVALIGDLKNTDINGKNVRLPNGSIAATTQANSFSGSAGLALELGRDTEFRLEATQDSDTTGGQLSLTSGTPDSFGYLRGGYHTPYLDTPTAIASRANIDSATLGYTQQFAYGLWGSASGHYTRYNIHGNYDVASTDGWDANLRWNTDIWDGLLAGISYDGHGDYRFSSENLGGAAPTPFVPLGIRDIENHAVTATLSSSFGWGMWFDAYAGYVTDRFASNGLLAGLDLHFTPQPGVDVALGIRQSAVSYTQGEIGRQTTAGLNMTMGFGAPPQPTWMTNGL